MNLSQPSSHGRKRTGRPLSFDRAAALERAMLAFWRHGYETTSIVDLTTAMGVTAPSLYTAFGDKKQLFLEAIRLYVGDEDAQRRNIAEASSALDAARTLLVGSAEKFTGEGTPPGCLAASATATGSAEAADVRIAVAEIRKRTEGLLRARIVRDMEDGNLPPTTDAAGLSGMVMAVMQGLSVLARDGASRARLMSIIDCALAAWPAQSGFQRTEATNPRSSSA